MRVAKLKITFIVLLAFILLPFPIKGEEPVSSSIPRFKISIFSGELKDTETLKNIPEEKISVHQLNMQHEKENLIHKINTFFNDKIENLRFESSGTFVKTSKDAFEKATWSANGFMIKLKLAGGLESEQEASSSLKGKILMTETRKNVGCTNDFQFKNENDSILLVLIRSKEKLALVVLQGAEKEEMYHTEARYGTFTVYSMDMNWSDTQLSADEIFFTKARAVIPTGKGDLVLKGEKIYFSKKDNRLIGYNAVIIDSNGNQQGKNNTITISLENPLDFKIE